MKRNTQNPSLINEHLKYLALASNVILLCMYTFMKLVTDKKILVCEVNTFLNPH